MLLHVCPFSPACVPMLQEMKVLVFAFHKSQITTESTFFNKWCKEMSSLLIYMAKYWIVFLLLELHPLKVAPANLSQFSRLSPTNMNIKTSIFKILFCQYFARKKCSFAKVNIKTNKNNILESCWGWPDTYKYESRNFNFENVVLTLHPYVLLSKQAIF